MSGLGDRVYQLITGHAPATAGSWLTQLAELRDRARSGRALAKQLGVNESIVRRALSGKTRQPKASTLMAIRRAWVAREPLSESAVELTTTDRDSGRTRVLTGEALKLAPGTMQRAADAWIRTGDVEQAGAAFLAGVGVPFYRAYLRPPPSEHEDQGEEEEGGEEEGEPADELEEWPYDDFDLAYEEVFGDAPEDYGGMVA